jgi:hypothetical protein
VVPDVYRMSGLVRAGHLAGVAGGGAVAPGEIIQVGDQGVTAGADGQRGGGQVDDRDAGLGVGQDGQDIPGGQPVVDGSEDGPALGCAIENFGELQAAGADEGDAVAGGHALAQ